MVDRAGLEAMLAAGNDNALLRFALGNSFMTAKDYGKAARHFRRAIELDPGYSAAGLDGDAKPVHPGRCTPCPPQYVTFVTILPDGQS
ncbi:MAG: tetratricopeptide repeat protein [Gammaproteobacteria bacterium]|nr:tetratricopeptide repeat protein [Gammaproteobacteria bacterium]